MLQVCLRHSSLRIWVTKKEIPSKWSMHYKSPIHIFIGKLTSIIDCCVWKKCWYFFDVIKLIEFCLSLLRLWAVAFYTWSNYKLILSYFWGFLSAVTLFMSYNFEMSALVKVHVNLRSVALHFSIMLCFMLKMNSGRLKRSATLFKLALIFTRGWLWWWYGGTTDDDDDDDNFPLDEWLKSNEIISEPKANNHFFVPQDV